MALSLSRLGEYLLRTIYPSARYSSMSSKNKTKLAAYLSFKESFIAIALIKLNKKEKQKLKILAQKETQENATQTVRNLVIVLNCAPSTVWATIRSLRSLNLISYNRPKEDSLSLSKTALFLVEKLQ